MRLLINISSSLLLLSGCAGGAIAFIGDHDAGSDIEDTEPEKDLNDPIDGDSTASNDFTSDCDSDSSVDEAGEIQDEVPNEDDEMLDIQEASEDVSEIVEIDSPEVVCPGGGVMGILERRPLEPPYPAGIVEWTGSSLGLFGGRYDTSTNIDSLTYRLLDEDFSEIYPETIIEEHDESIYNADVVWTGSSFALLTVERFEESGPSLCFLRVIDPDGTVALGPIQITALPITCRISGSGIVYDGRGYGVVWIGGRRDLPEYNAYVYYKYFLEDGSVEVEETLLTSEPDVSDRITKPISMDDRFYFFHLSRTGTDSRTTSASFFSVTFDASEIDIFPFSLDHDGSSGDIFIGNIGDTFFLFHDEYDSGAGVFSQKMRRFLYNGSFLSSATLDSSIYYVYYYTRRITSADGPEFMLPFIGPPYSCCITDIQCYCALRIFPTGVNIQEPIFINEFTGEFIVRDSVWTGSSYVLTYAKPGESGLIRIGCI